MFISDLEKEEIQSIFQMERAYRIIRRSIYIFLQNYHYFTFTAAFLAFPFSVSALLSHAFLPSSPLLLTIRTRLHALFDAAGLPPSSEFFSVLCLKLSQTISSVIFTLPFTLSFFLIAKAYIFQSLRHQKPAFPPSFLPFVSLYNSLIITHIYNSFVILSANATSITLLFLGFNSIQGLGFSTSSSLLPLSIIWAILYSVILANVLVISNLTLTISGMERSNGGFMTILQACVLLKGRTSTAISLALPVNVILAAIEALFQYRIIRTYQLTGKLSSFGALEGMFIAYLYSIIIVLETITSTLFYKSCNESYPEGEDDRYSYRINVEHYAEEGCCFDSSKASEGLQG